MSAQPVNYFTESWRMLTNGDKSWILHVCILVLLQVIPLVGTIALLGYAYTWSNRTAWGMDTSPTDRPIDISKIMMLGLITGVVVFVWSIVIGFIYVFATALTSWIPILGIMFLILFYIPCAILSMLSIFAGQRAAIYNHVWPGLQLDKIFDMIQRDWRGLVKIGAYYLLFSALIIIASIIIFIPVMIPFFIGATGESLNEGTGIVLFLISLAPAFIFAIVGLLAIEFAGVLLSLLGINAIGLWMRQLHPETWGSYNDPVPQSDASVVSNVVYTPQASNQNISQVEVHTGSTIVGPPEEANSKPQDERIQTDEKDIMENNKYIKVDSDKDNQDSK